MLRRTTGTLVAIDSHAELGPPLSVWDGFEYKAYSFALEPGDTLVLYSDGIIEAMDVNDRQRLHEDLVRAGNTGLTRKQFQDSFGLTAAQVDALFKSVITVRMNVTGAAKLCTDATITGNMRLFGD